MWQMVSYIPTTLAFNLESDSANGDITLLSAKMATSFFLESFIHSKEKLNIVQWVELLTKQFDSSNDACSWLLSHMAEDNHWPVTIFLKCQVATIRQMFHRLCIHVIQKLRPMEKELYLLPWIPGSGQNEGEDADGEEDCSKYYPSKKVLPQVGSLSPIAKFVRMLLGLLESGAARNYMKNLSELFRFLFDFAKLGNEEIKLLLSVRTISIFVDFYLKAVKQSSEGQNPELVMSEDEEEDDDDVISQDVMALAPIAGSSNSSESNRFGSLDKMVSLLAILVERSRSEDDNLIHLCDQDTNALAGSGLTSTLVRSCSISGASAPSTSTSTSKTLPTTPKKSLSASCSSSQPLVFLYNVTKDNINTCQICNLIFSLTRNNHQLAERVASMVFQGVKQSGEHSMHFFRLLTLLTEFSGGPSGMPCYTNLVMHRVWDLAKACPQAALDWLSIQATRNRYVQKWLASTMETWVETFMIAHPNQKVRNSASFLVVSLVPSAHFRQAFRSTSSRPGNVSSVDFLLGNSAEHSKEQKEQLETLHEILGFLFGLLPKAKQYTDLQLHGSAKLVAYFQTMTHFLLSRREKLMFCRKNVKVEAGNITEFNDDETEKSSSEEGSGSSHFDNLWSLFHPKLSEPSIPVHHNKQALLNFWYNLCSDCPENVHLILDNPSVTKNIAFNYILADHEDHEVVSFNRMMLPTYYGLLRMCCVQSKAFTRQLSMHQNLQWAFKNITPYTTQYTLACDELFKLMSLFVENKTDENEAEIQNFKQQALQLYLTTLDGRTCWNALISALKILVTTNDDRLFVVYNNGLGLISEAFNMLHMMYHEATACHVTKELVELLNIFTSLLKAAHLSSSSSPKGPSSSGGGSGKNTNDLLHYLSRWKDMTDMSSRLLTLINSFTPPELREICLHCLKEMLMLWPTEMLGTLVPLLHRAHTNNAANNQAASSDESTVNFPLLGQYFPTRGRKASSSLKRNPPRPMFQMFVPSCHLEAHHGQDPDYDRALHRYFISYHSLVDLMVRLSVNEDSLNKMLVDLSAMVGVDGVSLHFQLFPKLWFDIYNTEVKTPLNFSSAMRDEDSHSHFPISAN